MAKQNNDKEHPVNAAILQYMESELSNIDVLRPFFGKLNGYVPYDEPELAKAIDTGDIESIKSVVSKLTTFDDSTNDDPESLSYYEEFLKGRPAVNDEQRKEQIKNVNQIILDEYKKHPLSKRGMAAAAGVVKNRVKDALDEDGKFEEGLQTRVKDLNEQAKKEKAKQLTSGSEQVNSSVKRTNMKKLSKSDMKKLSFALNALTKHFAEVEDEEEATPAPVDDTTDDISVEQSESPDYYEIKVSKDDAGILEDLGTALRSFEADRTVELLKIPERLLKMMIQLQ